MKTLPCLALLSLLSVSTPSTSLELGSDKELAAILNVNNAERLLLVGFPDQSMNRSQGGAPSAYRHRGSYQTTSWSKRVSDEIADDYSIEKLAEWPMTEIGVHCIVYLVPDNKSVPEVVEKLSHNSNVSIVQNMHLYSTQASTHDDPYLKLQSNLRDMQIDEAQNITTGKNVSIAVIDTGVDFSHPDLIDQVSSHENFSSSISTGFENDQHGTAIAGIMVAKQNNKTGIMGIAPDAKVIAYKACWPTKENSMEATCNSFTLSLAVNTAIKSGAKILNMSLGGPKDKFLEELLKKAQEKGMIVVAADEGADRNEIRFPASLPGVIGVQSAKPNTASNGIAAPGVKILTTLPHGTYDFISGSSIATAEVSGVIALLMQIKPDITFAEAKSILEKSSGSNGTFSGINASTAVSNLCKTAHCS